MTRSANKYMKPIIVETCLNTKRSLTRAHPWPLLGQRAGVRAGVVPTRPAFHRIISLLAVLALAGALKLHAAGTNFNSGSDGHLGALNVTTDTTLDLPPDGIFHYTTITVAGGATLRFNRNALNTPVYLLATGDVTISGTIDVSGGSPNGRTPGPGGPGGFDGGWGGNGGTGFGGTGIGGDGLGPGGGNHSLNVCCCYYHSWGGAFATVNSAGSGNTYGNSLCVPLIGGSGGAGTDGNPGGGGGGGGGAVLISSSSRIDLYGVVYARGADTYPGPGSGGAVRLVAPLVTGNGGIDTLGGYRGNCGWYGGTGRSRIDCLDGFAVRSLHANNSVSSRGSQMFVFPPYTNRLDIIEAAGRLISEGSTNGVVITLSAGSNPTNNVVVQARGFTNDVPIRLVVTPNDRASTSYDVTLAMTNNPSRLAVPVVLPIDSTVRVHVWTR